MIRGKNLTPLLLAGIFVLMLGLSYAAVPLYDLFCEALGIGGKTSGPYQAEVLTIDDTREVEVQFVVTNNATMPWEFYPVKDKVFVHPGESNEITFFAKNLTNKDMVGQAIPNILPNNAANFFHKTECFCFNSQPLQAGDDAELMVQFVIDPDLPRSVNTVTLSYTIFDITDRVADLKITQR